MKIINLTKNTTLAQEAVIAGSLLKRAIGLLGKRELPDGQALIIKPCKSVHTFFMRFSVDLLFVDRGERVVKILQRLPPFRLSSICLNADYVIELPAGKIVLTRTTINDRISIT